MLIKSVMLAPNQVVAFNDPRIKYPMYASTKFDGYRAVLMNDGFSSRSGKRHANWFLPTFFKELLKYREVQGVVLDGELWSPTLNFNALQSVLSSQSKPLPDDLGYYVFDVLYETEWGARWSSEFTKRYMLYMTLFQWGNPLHVVPVKQLLVNSALEAEKIFRAAVEHGSEGIMLKSPSSQYKYGRATLNEGTFFKFKKFETTDAVIIDFERGKQMKVSVAMGVRTKDSMGHLERSHKKDDYEENDLIGSVWVRIVKDQHYPVGTTCKVGLAKEFGETEVWLWKDRDKYIGRHVEIRFQKHGSWKKPRMGGIVRWRYDLDT